ncbi:uncharacterized protein LY89DRAFT_464533 [Mollisia scopiformis]|uniref:Peptidase S8/S53 domain-containing protein n=1 Tax=Mollisia scopiformis TaxID=149040 RepID=A0A194XJE2_MOLSC|nr:uncharacterized protein LY89DRAFT_464533 [Mollisia scopiformis]KUJ19882.1 hypothetical protein LY89DRAFT_464533 [Mollisia scopiformis]
MPPGDLWYGVWYKEIQKILSIGGIVVQSGGNTAAQQSGISSIPALWRDRKAAPIMVVGATDNFGVRTYFSNWGTPANFPGTGIDVYAPGLAITVDVANGGSAVKKGTSFATSFVAGLIAYFLNVDGHRAAIEESYANRQKADYSDYFNWQRVVTDYVTTWAYPRSTNPDPTVRMVYNGAIPKGSNAGFVCPAALNYPLVKRGGTNMAPNSCGPPIDPQSSATNTAISSKSVAPTTLLTTTRKSSSSNPATTSHPPPTSTPRPALSKGSSLTPLPPKSSTSQASQISNKIFPTHPSSENSLLPTNPPPITSAHQPSLTLTHHASSSGTSSKIYPITSKSPVPSTTKHQIAPPPPICGRDIQGRMVCH